MSAKDKPHTIGPDWQPPESPDNDAHALVVLSGGQDSVTCLGWALSIYREVSAIAFQYGQRHTVEIDQASKICEQTPRVRSFTVLDIPTFTQLGDSALLNPDDDVSGAHHNNSDLPASFVPNRNATLLTMAHAMAQRIGAEFLVTGVCETDYSGYPDCRARFIEAIEDALNTGAMTDITILTPLMHLNKAETFALADKCNILETVIELSHTCYNGVRDLRWDWGYGCGECPACKLRAEGWAQYQQGDYHGSQ